MKKILSALIAVCFALCSVPAVAQVAPSGRPIVYPSENPPSADTVLQPARFQRLALGTLMLNALNLTTNGAGVYSNCTTAPSSGLFVNVSPTVNNSLCALYQVAVDDANPIPVGFTPQLAADNTLIVVQALQSVTSNPIGPLTAPVTVGQSVYWLIEAQTQTTDVNSSSRSFLNGQGNVQSQSVPVQRQDAIAYQTKQGTPGVSPTQPSPDAGWIPIAYVLVAQGQSSITNGNISVGNLFAGFASNISGINLVPFSGPTPQSGNAAISGTFQATQGVIAGQVTDPSTTLSSCGFICYGTSGTAHAGAPIKFGTASGITFIGAPNTAGINGVPATVLQVLNSPSGVDMTIDGSGNMGLLGTLFGAGASLSNTIPLAFTSTTGAAITSNATGATVSFIFNAANATRPTGDIVDFQLFGSNVMQVTNSGGIIAQGAYSTTATSPLTFLSTTGSTVISQTLGANAGVTFNDTGSPFTGDLVDFQKAGTTLASVSNNGTFTAPALSVSTSGSGTAILLSGTSSNAIQSKSSGAQTAFQFSATGVSFTGDIADFLNGGVLFDVNNDGSLTWPALGDPQLFSNATIGNLPIALNTQTGTGYTGDLLDVEASGTPKVKISNGGNVSTVGTIAAGPSIAALTAGDIDAARGVSTGALFLGGATTSCREDFGINNATSITLACPLIVNGTTGGITIAQGNNAAIVLNQSSVANGGLIQSTVTGARDPFLFNDTGGATGSTCKFQNNGTTEFTCQATGGITANGPIGGASTNGGTSTFAPVGYTNAGAALGATAHWITFSCAFAAATTCNVTLTGTSTGQFTSATSYSCWVDNGSSAVTTGPPYWVGTQAAGSFTVFATASNSLTAFGGCLGT